MTNQNENYPSLMRKIITGLGFKKTNALVRETMTEIAVEEVDKSVPLREVSKKYDISIPALSNYIHEKIKALPLGRKRTGARGFKTSSGLLDETEAGMEALETPEGKKKVRKKSRKSRNQNTHQIGENRQ